MAADFADDVTRLAGGTAPATTDSGWARTTSGSIDHGRFEPGVILDNRWVSGRRRSYRAAD